MNTTTATATTALTHQWRIRPLAPTRRRPYRRYVAVCRWSDRVELCSGPEHTSVADCREYIRREWDGGRKAPPRVIEIKDGYSDPPTAAEMAKYQAGF